MLSTLMPDSPKSCNTGPEVNSLAVKRPCEAQRLNRWHHKSARHYPHEALDTTITGSDTKSGPVIAGLRGTTKRSNVDIKRRRSQRTCKRCSGRREGSTVSRGSRTGGLRRCCHNLQKIAHAKPRCRTLMTTQTRLGRQSSSINALSGYHSEGQGLQTF